MVQQYSNMFESVLKLKYLFVLLKTFGNCIKLHFIRKIRTIFEKKMNFIN